MLRPGGTATISAWNSSARSSELLRFDFLREQEPGLLDGRQPRSGGLPRLLSLLAQGRLKLDHLIPEGSGSTRSTTVSPG